MLGNRGPDSLRVSAAQRRAVSGPPMALPMHGLFAEVLKSGTPRAPVLVASPFS